MLILPALFAGVLLLAPLHRVAAKGWPERRLRRVAVIAGIVAGAPTLIFIPAGALYGLIVPLPGAGPAVRRRVLVRTALGVLGLLALLVPLSLVAPNG